MGLILWFLDETVLESSPRKRILYHLRVCELCQTFLTLVDAVSLVYHRFWREQRTIEYQ
jgi:hypothetical protein